MELCVIVGAGPVDELIPASHGDFVIAADGGASALKIRGLSWDLALGDFDSLGHIPQTERVILHPAEKDDTDMMLAVREGLSRGFRTFVIYGGLGGREDHSLANLQILRSLAERGCRGFLLGEGAVVTAVRNGRIDFDPGQQGIVSVFCAGDKAEGVTIRGLRYKLEGATLTGSEPRGVSNEFTGQDASIIVERGVLWVYWSEEPKRLLDRLHSEQQA